MEELTNKWKTKLEETRLKDKADKRNKMLFDTLKYGAGIYVNDSKAVALNLTKTVYITLYDNENDDQRYIRLLKNQMCFSAQHGFKALIYVLNIPDNSTLSDLYDDLRQINPSIRLITYPTHSFYRFLIRKKDYKEKTFGIADFLGNIINYNIHSFDNI